MASKSVKTAALATKVKKKSAVKVVHPPFFKTTIRAGQATPAPPLGTNLGLRGINVAQFVRDFNKATDAHVPGVPLPTLIAIGADRSVKMDIRTPTQAWLIMRAAGLRRGGTVDAQGEFSFISKHSVAEHTRIPIGRITLKHVYEIAKIKASDAVMHGVDMQTMCANVIAQCHTIGVKVVPRIDDLDEFAAFLQRSKERVAADVLAQEEAKAAKLLRQ